MKRDLNHEEAFLALDAVALDAADAAERDAVLAHAEHCAVCQVELSQLRETAAVLALSSPLGADTATGSRARVHSRLMARASADTPAGGSPEASLSFNAGTRRRVSALAWRRAEWMAIAAGVMLVASVSLLAGVMRDRESLRAELMTRDSVIAGLTGKDVAMMTLTSNGTKAPFAHMFWDQAHNTWTMIAHNLPDPKPGRTYQLWFVTSKAKISAGTFVSHGGDAMIRTTYALSAKDLTALAVTEEPMGGMPQPTGPMVMALSAQ